MIKKGTVKSAQTAPRSRRYPPLPVPTDSDYPPHGGVGYGGMDTEENPFRPGQSIKQWIIGAVIVLLVICFVLYFGPGWLSGGMLGSE